MEALKRAEGDTSEVSTYQIVDTDGSVHTYASVDDIPEEHRPEVVAAGAVEVSSRELLRRLRAAG